MSQHNHQNSSTKNTEGCCSHDHENAHFEENSPTKFRIFLPALLTFLLLITGIIWDNYTNPNWFQNEIRFIWYLSAFLPVGFPVVKEAFESARNGELFSEFFLMSIATIGAFVIGEYPEGVAVMLFYTLGENLQNIAVNKAKTNIKNLLDQRPDEVTVLENSIPKKVAAANVSIGSIIELRAGEKAALDGVLLSEKASFNTAALTGESTPDTKHQNETVLAGMINLNTVVQIKVTNVYSDSKLSKILELVQEATSKKAPTELFIRKFAKIYTPIVTVLAVLICLLPYFFIEDYIFKDWLYRALVFLVISCPCALVISIPLGYFGGIGAASKNGILFKGAVFLDAMANLNTVVLDKTGTLTKGLFKVQKVVPVNTSETELIQYTAALETQSTHPVASAIVAFAKEKVPQITASGIEEIAGHGLKGIVNGQTVLVGNTKLLQKFNITYDKTLDDIPYTLIVVAINNQFSGYFVIADELKEDAKTTIQQLTKQNIAAVVLSGDKEKVVNAVAKELGILKAYGNLLPEDKVDKVNELKKQNLKIAFVGDGVNDAPVIALADVGIAMGGLGSDAAIQTADVVIQNDQLHKISTAIQIAKKTKQIVWQNIAMAFVVKFIVLALGAGGLATMWEAVFADVGVAFLAILNAIRIQKSNFNT
ncbi:heavy metal translocating P-type ATPase [Flavobacterium agrisoli]|uniref:P-type Zn(2+) transporter n=1 Tax=Flavobacterium agrisoli TaxID=2793066 RepID=A0A934UIX9_9FLAO|nr:heavy metal translocating P-type ATPase [Flavobacterium agrisoli]MBK0369029.1 cadmium-translocating P-type ATPase [Flavobacterium agrisoli]